MKKHLVLFSLGSNLGNRVATLNKAIKALEDRLQSHGTVSSFYESEPWGFSTDDLFLNCCVGVQTVYSPQEILTFSQEIEKILGREEKTANAAYASRIIDIDILYCGDCILSSETLTIPHPLLYQRNFVLFPLAEIYPNFIDPQKKEMIRSLKEKCTDKQKAMVYTLDK